MAIEPTIGTVENGEESAQPSFGLSCSVVVLALVFLALSLIWMLYAGIIGHGAQLGESVPVVPAVSALLVLTLMLPLLQRLPPALRVNRAGVLMVYAFLCIAVSMNSVGVVRLLFPSATALYYFATPENNFSELQVPALWAPRRTLMSSAGCMRAPTTSACLGAWRFSLGRGRCSCWRPSSL